MSRWAVGTVLGALAAVVAARRRALTRDGAVAAAVVGCVTYARGGLSASGALLAFFISSSALSRLGERRKRDAPLAQAKGAQRDAQQVLANGGVAIIALLIDGRRGQRAFAGALAAAAADTWATELGMLCGGSPRLITTWRRVPPGTSGGVTLAGLGASLGGALLIALAALRSGAMNRPRLRRVVGAGLAGSVVDSLLGATIQAGYVCRWCNEPTEQSVHRRCGRPTELVRGWPWATNDAINALATLAGATISALPR